MKHHKINIKFKQEIADCMKVASDIHTKWREIYKNANDTFANKPIRKLTVLYKAIAGDDIDEMFAFQFNKIGIQVPIKRLGRGNYLFGTMKIYTFKLKCNCL